MEGQNGDNGVDIGDELTRRRRDPRAVAPFVTLGHTPDSARDSSGRPGAGGVVKSPRRRQVWQPVAHISREKQAAAAEEAWAPAR